MKIDDRPIETPKLKPEELRIKSVQPATNHLKAKPVEAVDRRRKKKDRRKRQLNWHGKFDMRSGKDRRKRDPDHPSIDIDV